MATGHTHGQGGGVIWSGRSPIPLRNCPGPGPRKRRSAGDAADGEGPFASSLVRDLRGADSPSDFCEISTPAHPHTRTFRFGAVTALQSPLQASDRSSLHAPDAPEAADAPNELGAPHAPRNRLFLLLLRRSCARE
jgi:hypothetical protein